MIKKPKRRQKWQGKLAGKHDPHREEITWR
jgi:hypothetical protein